MSTSVAEAVSEMQNMYSRRVEEEWRRWEPGGIHQRDPHRSQWGSHVRKSFLLLGHYKEVGKNASMKM